MSTPDKTEIIKFTPHGEAVAGYVEANGAIYAHHDRTTTIGRWSADQTGRGHIFQRTRHDERELGTFTPDGTIHSHGLLEGGTIGWLESDQTVVRSGLIFGEKEVGRITGPHAPAGAAALLLIFLPADQELNRRRQR